MTTPKNKIHPKFRMVSFLTCRQTKEKNNSFWFIGFIEWVTSSVICHPVHWFFIGSQYAGLILNWRIQLIWQLKDQSQISHFRFKRCSFSEGIMKNWEAFYTWTVPFLLQACAWVLSKVPLWRVYGEGSRTDQQRLWPKFKLQQGFMIPLLSRATPNPLSTGRSRDGAEKHWWDDLKASKILWFGLLCWQAIVFYVRSCFIILILIIFWYSSSG